MSQKTENYAFWHDQIAHFLADDPAFLAVYKRFLQAPWQEGHLTTKTKELLNVALSASPTHLNQAATRHHIQKALQAGATKAEIAEVLKVVSILGVHTCAVGIPLMMVHYRDSLLPDSSPYTAQQLTLKKKFIDTMGYWNDFRDDLLQMDIAYFEAYYEFLTLPIRRGILEPKIIEFIYIAIDASTTHLFTKGIEVHLKNAIQYGATKEELLQVFQLTSAQGFHTLLDMLPILEEEWERTVKG